MQSQFETLSNGLKTLFIDVPGSSCATAQIWFRAGSSLEETSNAGIAHFLEHMFFKGTKKRPGMAIAKQVEEVGGELNAFTSFDYTCYYINIPNDHLLKAADILLDMVSKPAFKKQDLGIEREVVLEEFLRSIDEPGQYRFKQIQEHSFSKGYSHQILGTKKTITNFTIRQLQQFRNKNYGVENTLFVLGGSIGAKKKPLMQLLSKYKLPKGSKAVFPKFKLKHELKVQGHTKDIKTSSITFVLEASPLQNRMAALEDMAVSCLGHGESSPLYKHLIVDKNVAIASSASSMFFNNGGVHFIKISFAPENFKDVLAETLTCIRKVIHEGFEKSDIMKIKNQYVASKLFEKETVEFQAFSLGHSYAQLNDVFAEEKFLQTIKSLTPEEINGTLGEIFLKNMHIEIQCPKDSNIKSLRSELQIFGEEIKKISKKLAPSIHIGKKNKYDPQTSMIEIKPGIKLLHRRNSIAPSFVMQTLLNSGMSDETATSIGNINMLSSLLPLSNNLLDRNTMSQFIEERSANFSGFSGKNAYGLTMHGLSQDFDELSSHFLCCLREPAFKDSDLEIEKEMVTQALLNKFQDPARLCFSKVNEIMFSGHGYALEPLGTEESIAAMTVSGLKKLHKAKLLQDEMLLCIFGDISLDTSIRIIEKQVHDLPNRNKSTILRKKQPYKAEICHIDLEREQNHVYIGVPTSGIFEHESVVAKMLTSHLSGQSSKIFYEMRDVHGLCYAIRAFHFTALEHGHWGIYFASAPSKTAKAIELVNESIANITKELTKIQFEKLKLMIDGQNKLAMQTNEDFASAYSLPLLHGKKLDYHFEECKRIEKMNYKDFMNGLAVLFEPQPSMVICGPGAS